MVAALQYRKELPDSVYLHRDTLEATHPELFRFVFAVAKAVQLTDEEWNIVKLAKRDFRLSLLNYPTFFTESYPALTKSVAVDLTKLSHRITDYDAHDNPPILHRKESFLCPDHPLAESFFQITKEGELAGLYENSRLIGFKDSWNRLIAKHGYQLADGRLFRSSSLPIPDADCIDRHKTALVRYELSAPMKTLARHGYLNGEFSIFDYGCGRGNDLSELEANGLDATGWDPNYRPDSEKIPSSIVNLGYVINVIEDIDERIEALLAAWDLASTLLVVSAMLATESFISQFKPYKDGVITSRNTFQRYYAQTELKGFIDRTLEENSIAVNSGIFYIFKDKLEEQRFLSQRQRRHHEWTKLSRPKFTTEDKARKLIEENKELFEEFWQRSLYLGRTPANDEFDKSQTLRSLVGSHAKAIRLLSHTYDLCTLDQASLERKNDLLVYLALNLFEKRKPYTSYPLELQRDIKVHFGNFNNAIEQAQDLLFSIANIEAIAAACEKAHETLPASLLNDSHSLILHKRFSPDLPPLLRVYVGAACQLYGELEEIHLIKIHIRSGKVSLMGYDNYSNPIPLLKERIKIKMAEQEVDFFDYIEESK
ncbi:DNA phosphorothioation-associated putative methyltransferase [Pseudomonas sp. BN415]|uniref:DNA phosphorothioation-associated putative methyltransferase n=1 Tax=Pseudomonas sp. BN415 TaxID=2567889 RepID=UPI002458F80C|nr:DNA phosphorothioation-associated putative methyltransferase [Pseudomonas sp. BN415]